MVLWHSGGRGEEQQIEEKPPCYGYVREEENSYQLLPLIDVVGGGVELHHSGARGKVLHHTGAREKELNHTGARGKILHHSGARGKVLQHSP